MNLKDKIIPREDFQYSVNIEYDLNSEEKIKGYIPTVGGLSIIEDVMLSAIPSSRDRARLFVGAYGKGKSHLVLTILALLSKKDKSLFTAVLNKAKEVNPKFYKYLVDYIDSDRKLLPVVIQGSSNDVNQAFLLSLRTALESNDLGSILPDSYFTSAIQMINTWQKDYVSTYNLFKEKINEPANEFVEKLNLFDNETYLKFIKIYPELTSGSVFTPVKGLDIVRVYEDVSKKIKKYGYNGIFVVYDEFSKFLENSIGNSSAMEIKMIQDFAELCNRSLENQMHILLISHKHIQNYISKLPKEKIDSWAAVSERFKTVEIHNNFSQTYEIISTVIQKDNNWFNSFVKENSDNFTLLQDEIEKINVLSDLSKEERELLPQKAYPLDPTSLFILPRISELVAQNERTIFTFLASNQKHSLTDFINNTDDEFPLITPDFIYDYFEQLFKKESYYSSTFKIWNTCNNAIIKLESKTNNVLTYKIIKTIALLWILQQQDNRISPTIETIINIYKPKYKDTEIINDALKELKQYGIISLLDSNNFITIGQGSGIDIQKQIEDAIVRLKNGFNGKDELNNIVKNKFIYPSRYNDENAIIRYFQLEFINADEIMEVTDWDKKIEPLVADGIIYLILEDGNVNRSDLSLKINDVDNNRIVFIKLNKQEKINKTLLKLKALNFIQSSAKESEKNLIKEELSVYYDDCMQIVNKFVDYYLSPELGKAIYINNGNEIKKIKRKSNVSQLLSAICEEVYYDTPRINNELINRNNISSNLFNARHKVLSGLLQNEIKSNLGLSGSGPEINIMRSVLFAYGILEQDNTQIKIEGLKNNSVQRILNICKDFFIKSGNPNGCNFSELYSQLTLPQNGIGLKKGVIPIYIAVLLHLYKQHSAIMGTNGKEIEISASVLENINKVPDSYKLILEDWNQQKQDYIDNLESLFINFIQKNEKEYNSFDYITRAMQRWFAQLPKYAKEVENVYVGNEKFEKIDIKARKLRNQLRSEINAREFLFKTIPAIYGKEFDKLLFNAIKKTVTLFDDLLENTCDYLSQDIKNLFNGKENATLVSTLKDWNESLNKTTKTFLFNNGNESIFEYIDHANNNDYELLIKIAKQLTGLRMTDWSDETLTLFIDSLKKFKATVEKQNTCSKPEGNLAGLYRIAYIDDNGNEEIKTLSKIETSKKAELLNNDVISLLEDYGESISTNEKRQVLLDILQKLK